MGVDFPGCQKNDGTKSTKPTKSTKEERIGQTIVLKCNCYCCCEPLGKGAKAEDMERGCKGARAGEGVDGGETG